MKHSLAAYPWEHEEWADGDRLGAFLECCMEFQGNMQPFKKTRAAWMILGRGDDQSQESAHHAISNDLLTAQNLQLLRGEKEDERLVSVAQLVAPTYTKMGEVTKCAWIAQPLDNSQKLMARQSYARFFTEQQVVLDQISKQLEMFKESENFFMSFWVNDPLKQTSQRNYFKLSGMKRVERWLNESPAALSMATAFAHKGRIISCLAAALATGVLPAYGIAQLISDKSGPNHFDRIAHRLVGAGGPLFGLIIEYINNPYVQAAGFVTAGAYCGSTTVDQYEWTRDNFTISKCLQTKLYHVARCLKALESIGNLLQNTELEFALDKNVHELMQKFKAVGTDTHKLYQLLQSSTFETEGKTIAHWGEILVAYRMMHEHAQEFEPLLRALGELDVYVSVARFYKKFEHNRVRYSFVSYVDSNDAPQLVFNDMWSPFIDPELVVTNSVSLGAELGTRNMIITGPNEGGKSTFVKAVVVSAILAQSLGIVPASYAKITPFSYIATYLNITDDHGKSLFEAQVQRIKHILDRIEAVEQGKHSLVAIDELFNGTDARVGQAASYGVANYLSKKEGVISIFPTHFPELTDLENQGNSVNYKVLAVVDDKGKITYPFTIQRGASQQNIVFDILRSEGFNSGIIAQAQTRLP